MLAHARIEDFIRGRLTKPFRQGPQRKDWALSAIGPFQGISMDESLGASWTFSRGESLGAHIGSLGLSGALWSPRTIFRRAQNPSTGLGQTRKWVWGGGVLGHTKGRGSISLGVGWGGARAWTYRREIPPLPFCWRLGCWPWHCVELGRDFAGHLGTLCTFRLALDLAIRLGWTWMVASVLTRRLGSAWRSGDG